MSVEHRDDQFEDRLGAALRNAGGAFDADRAALVAGGETRGRRLRMRRRTAVVSGAAAIALVGVGGALITPWGGDGSGQRSAGATGTTVGPGDATGTPTGASTGTATSPAVSGAQLLATFKGLLPEGKLSEESARGTDSKRGPYVYAVFDDGKGAAALSLSFGRVAPGSDQARWATQCPDTAFGPYDECARSTLPGGSALVILKGYEFTDRRLDTKLWKAVLVTPDGGQLTVSEWNSAAEKGAPISRPEPPLSSRQLKTLVTDPAWLKVVDTLPEVPQSPQSPTPSSGSGNATLLTTLTGLLPKGQDLRVVRKSGEGTEFGYVVVDDGKGESFVQINVQPNMQDVEDDLFGEGSGAVTLPDGIKVVVRQGPGDDKGKGLVMRTADAFWPDGLRVVVSAFNSASQITGPTRENPALTLDQLKAIATDSKWQQLQPAPN
ncbi:hypothetical protein ACOT81_30840 [Streptomyces sp. WI04-05B]|uniref:hypothetical protein n=1 Tax=Streptomyces TaxID=1883 RepID=UPI0029B87693|nr:MULTISPECIES: hypothetical protein [unclassified Streptomyces]MDX2542311.1 hypothetical protein [Streptomyces sp. WI04-05B]MDX2584143.1 hypothetical protein [Streptomyces sp. WI04-05A]